MIIEIVVGVICICDRIVQQVFNMQKRNILHRRRLLPVLLIVEQNQVYHKQEYKTKTRSAMEVDGNVAKVKMSKFRPTMDFNKV